MTHFTVTVHTPEAKTIEEAVVEVVEVLAPYAEEVDDPAGHPRFVLETEDGESWWTNPDALWDWYQIGGRWAGSLIVGAGVETWVGSAGTARGRPGRVPEMLAKSHVSTDVAKRGDIDLEALGLRSYEENLEEHARLQTDEWALWVREGVAEQARVMGAQEWARGQMAEKGPWHTVGWLDAGGYRGGDMGWFGVTVSEEEGWGSAFQKLLAAVPADQFVVVVDCHI